MYFVRAVTDDDVGTVFADGGQALVRAAGADDAEAARVRELHRGDADAAGGAVNENGFAGLRVARAETTRDTPSRTARQAPRPDRKCCAAGRRCT